MYRSFLAAVSLTLLVGCAAAETDRQTRVLAMASDEAQQITDPRERLTRQLNFANTQQLRGHAAESRQSLAHAAQTLRDSQTQIPDPLTTQQRIAGWVSISELSRQINNDTAASTACDQAVLTLRGIEPETDRPQYAVGVAREVQALHGNAPASALLLEASNWTRDIDNLAIRRLAISSIADELFQCNDYDDGLKVLRKDSDPVWRSDTLTALADAHMIEIKRIESDSFVSNLAASAPSSGQSKLQQPYNKQVDFQSLFQRN